MKDINRQLVSELKDLKKSVTDADQKKLIELIIKVIEKGDDVPPPSTLSALINKNNKPIVYKVVDLLCIFVLRLAEHEACVKTLKLLESAIKYLGTL